MGDEVITLMLNVNEDMVTPTLPGQPIRCRIRWVPVGSDSRIDRPGLKRREACIRDGYWV